MNPSDPSKARIVRAIDAVCGLPAAVATWALWCAVAIGYLGLHAWIFELFANFTAQYMALFAICVIALTLARWRKTAIVALLGVAHTTASMAPYFQDRVVTDAPANRFRLVTFNTWYRNDDVARMAEFLRTSEADVVVLQEVELARLDALASLLPEFPYRSVTPISRYALVIFSRWPMEAEPMNLSKNMARMARMRLDWQGTQVTFFGAHLSWPLSRHTAAARALELDALAAATSAARGPVLVAGDFNLTPWSQYFGRFVARSGLADCALGQGLLATWPSQFLPIRIRIDHCFASADWRVHRVEVGPKLGSDHLPVIVDLALAAASAADSE